jgi:hypothetical protein
LFLPELGLKPGIVLKQMAYFFPDTVLPCTGNEFTEVAGILDPGTIVSPAIIEYLIAISSLSHYGHWFMTLRTKQLGHQ